jgi:hypothetical protein
MKFSKQFGRFANWVLPLSLILTISLTLSTITITITSRWRKV